MDTYSIIFVLLMSIVIGIIVGTVMFEILVPFTRIPNHDSDDEHEEKLVWWDFD